MKLSKEGVKQIFVLNGNIQKIKEKRLRQCQTLTKRVRREFHCKEIRGYPKKNQKICGNRRYPKVYIQDEEGCKQKSTFKTRKVVRKSKFS